MARKKVEEVESLTFAALEDALDNTENYNDIIPENRRVSFGSLFVDRMLKIRSGSVIRLTGKGHELGKTSQAFVLAKNFMETMPNSKTLYIPAEARFAKEKREATGLTFYEKKEDIRKWKAGSVFIYHSNEFESVAKTIRDQLDAAFQSGEFICIIVDSLDGLILKDDLEKKEFDNKNIVAGVPKMTKLLFRHVAMKIVHYDALLILTSQYSTDIQLNQYADKRQGSAAGGTAVGHQSDYILNYLQRSGGDIICENPDEKPNPVTNKPVGVWAKFKVEKSSTAISGVTLDYPVKSDRKGNGIWTEKEVADLLLNDKLVDKKGAWMTFSDAAKSIAKSAGITLKDQVQGLNALYDYIQSDPALCKVFCDHFLSASDTTVSNSDFLVSKD